MEIKLESGLKIITGKDFVPKGDQAVSFSVAISLKRIADSLEKLTGGNGLEAIIDKVAQHPINAYGEGLGDAIQNGMARGLQGINTHDLRRY